VVFKLQQVQIQFVFFVVGIVLSRKNLAGEIGLNIYAEIRKNLDKGQIDGAAVVPDNQILGDQPRYLEADHDFLKSRGLALHGGTRPRYY
jgi:hypothetical protein